MIIKPAIRLRQRMCRVRMADVCIRQSHIADPCLLEKRPSLYRIVVPFSVLQHNTDGNLQSAILAALRGDA